MNQLPVDHKLFLILVLLILQVLISFSSATNKGCVSWTEKENVSSEDCTKCIKDDFFNGRLICNEKTHALSVLDCNCIYYDNFTERIQVGPCMFNCLTHL